MDVVSYQAAKSLGLKYYFTGKPCKHGGVAPRRVSDSACTCSNCSEIKAERDRDRYLGNKDSIRERHRSYDQSNSEAIAERKRRYRSENSEEIALKSRARYLLNREARAAFGKAYRKKNPDKVASKRMKRRATVINSKPSWYGELDDFLVREAFELAAIRFAETGIEWELDHMVPLQAKGCRGLHCADNLQLIPKIFNREKGNRLVLTKPLEWLNYGVLIPEGASR